MKPLVRSFIADPKGEADPEVGGIDWSQDLETGMEVLDNQHRRYIELLNVYLAKATDNSLDNEEKSTQLAESLKFLCQYANEHFVTEASIMKEAGFPDIEAHLEEHDYFLEHVRRLSRQLETYGFSAKLSREVNYYIVEWFIQHILLMDMQLVDFLRIRSEKLKVVPR